MTMKLARNCLRARDVSELEAFYCSVLGMRQLGSADAPAFGYDAVQCLLSFHEGEFAPYAASQSDLYWKIGITLRDLGHAVDYLNHAGWAVSEPRQFGDIGYLCHLRDPAGFSVELLQQGFEGNASPAGGGHAIGGQATLAHLTLRIGDIAAARQFCEHRLGMRLMSVQPVTERGFTLYFYGWSQEALPNPDLEAIENREWLWARPYTLLELQHLETGAQITSPDERACGFAGLAVEDAAGDQTYVSSRDLTDLY